jgi:hypothetical protein
MVYAIVEVCCSPNGDEKYPVPTTLQLVRIFSDAREAMQEFPSDQVIKAESEYAGQDIYYLLWNTDEKMNLDRCIQADNVISNVGLWLPENERLYGDVTDLEVELIPPQRIKQRAKQRERAQQTASKERKRQGDGKKARTTINYGDEQTDEEYQGSGRIGPPAGGTSVGRSIGGTPWKQRW